MSSNIGMVPLPALSLLLLLLYPTRAVCIPAVGGASQDVWFQVFRILQSEKPARNTSSHDCDSVLLCYPCSLQGAWARWPLKVPSNPKHSVIWWFCCHCKVQMQSTSEDQASHSGGLELETWSLTFIHLCSGFPITETAVAAVMLKTSRPLCYLCQAVFQTSESPHPNVALPLLSGCSKADVSGLPLSWCFWVLCCENLLENHVILWKDWPVFKGKVWKRHTNIRHTEKKATQEREKPAKNTNWEGRPAVSEQIAQLLCGRPKAGDPRDSGEGM